MGKEVFLEHADYFGQRSTEDGMVKCSRATLPSELFKSSTTQVILVKFALQAVVRTSQNPLSEHVLP